MFLIFTGYLAAAYALQVPKGYDQEQLILGLIYAFFCLNMLFKYIPFSWITTPMWTTWDFVSKPVYRIPRRWRMVGFGFLDAVVIIVTIFSIEAESTRIQRLIALVGMVIFISGLYITSRVSLHHTTSRSVTWCFERVKFLSTDIFVSKSIVDQLIGPPYGRLYCSNSCLHCLSFVPRLAKTSLNGCQLLHKATSARHGMASNS